MNLSIYLRRTKQVSLIQEVRKTAASGGFK